MDPLKEILLTEILTERERRNTLDAMTKSRISIDELTKGIEAKLQENPELKEMFEELQARKKLSQAAKYHRVKGGNAHRLGVLSTAAVIGFGILSIGSGVVSLPYFILTAVGLLGREVFMGASKNRYKDAQEVLQRKPLGDVRIKSDAIDAYVAEINELRVDERYSVQAEPLEQEPNQIWISAGDGYSFFRVANLYHDKALVTDFYTAIEMPKVVPLESLPIKLLKEAFGIEQAEFNCPAHGISRARDQMHYKAAQQVREVALRYAA